MSQAFPTERWVTEELLLSLGEVGPPTALLGRQSVLDSMGLVHLLAALEERIAAETGQDLVLADDKAMSAVVSPFRSVQSLARFIAERLDNPA